MGWFDKKNKKRILEDSPSLPEMPKLPELPKIGEELNELPQLPSYPSSSFGKKFSQNVIKEAVSGGKMGEKEVEDKEVFKADESFPEDEEETMQKPPIELTKELPQEKVESLPNIKSHDFVKTKIRETEPVFVRMDKFEESLDIFEKAKKKISEIEKFLIEIKKMREKEETELQEWENEIGTIKKQFERIDRNLFSKI